MMMLPMPQQQKQQQTWGQQFGSFMAKQSSPWTKVASAMKRIGQPKTVGQETWMAQAARRAKRRMMLQQQNQFMM